MKKLAIALLLLAFARSVQAAENPFLDLPDSHSAAFSEGQNAALLNPVFADTYSAPALSYRYLQYENKGTGNHIGSIGIEGFSFTYGWFANVYNKRQREVQNPGINFYNISKGFFFNNFWGFGAGYSFGTSRDSSYDRYKSLTLGLLLRPSRFISFGGAVNDLFGTIGGGQLKHREVYAAALRPFTDRVTLSADASRFSGQSFRNISWTFGAEARIFYDISLFAKSGEGRDFNFGFRVPVSVFSISGQYNNYKGGAAAESLGISIPFRQGEGVSAYGKILALSIGNIREFEKESFFGKRRPNLTDIIMGIRCASTDSEIKGLIIEVNAADFAHAQEIRGAIQAFRASGKPVYAVTASPGNTAYYIAAAADKIYYAPNSMFGLPGLSANVYFFKKLMAKIGLSFDVFKHGKYKSAYESFTNEGLSPAARENLISIVADLNEQFISDIKNDRELSDQNIARLFEESILSPTDAKELGFIDEDDYYEQALYDLKEKTGTKAIAGFNSYIAVNDISSGIGKKDFSWGRKPVIAIVHVDGTILQDESALLGNGIGTGTYLDMLTEVFEDSSVAAVVIRISSGGGSALASDFMQYGLVNLQKKYSKPV
ncbi:MAG: S49 family peptidase, partial [Spirochaetia bacterium]|nr:S49 family peptidase [Spirochaetia bacterium]